MTGLYNKNLSNVLFEDSTNNTIDINLGEMDVRSQHDQTKGMFGLLQLECTFLPSALCNRSLGQDQAKQSSGSFDAPQRYGQGICYVQLKEIQLFNAIRPEYISLEICCNGAKFDLKESSSMQICKRQREIINTSCRLLVKEQEQGIELSPILINVLNMDNQGKEPEILDGEPLKVDLEILRQHHGVPVTMMLTKKVDGVSEDELKAVDVAQDLVRKMNKGLNVEKGELQILATFTFYSTPFTREPCGFVSLKGLQVFNLDHFQKKFKVEGQTYQLKFMLNQNKLRANLDEEPENAKEDEGLDKSQRFLIKEMFDEKVDILRQGKVFELKSATPVPRLNFLNNQIVLFTGHPMDMIKIQLVRTNDRMAHAKKKKKGLGNNLNQTFKPKSDMTPEELAAEKQNFENMAKSQSLKKPLLKEEEKKEEEEPDKTKKKPRTFLDVVATGTINLGDLSTTMNKKAEGTASNKFALLMNFVQENKPESMRPSKEIKINNLLSNRYFYKIILLFELKFHQNQELSAVQAQSNLIMKNVFFIQDRMQEMRNQIALEKQQKYGIQNSSLNQDDSEILELAKKGDPKFKLIEIKIQAIQSMLKEIDLDANMHANSASEEITRGFLIVEEASEHMPLKDYYTSTKNFHRLITGKNAKYHESNQVESAANFANLVADPKDLKNPKRSLSQLFLINKSRLFKANEVFESWVPYQTKNVILTLVHQTFRESDYSYEEEDFPAIEKFYKFLGKQHLGRTKTALGLLYTKFNSESDESKIQMAHQVLSLVSTNKDLADGLKIMVAQTNMAEINELNRLLLNPLSQCGVVLYAKNQISAFIDQPSGYLNIQIKSLKTNSEMKMENFMIMLELKSSVKLENVNENLLTWKQKVNNPKRQEIEEKLKRPGVDKRDVTYTDRLNEYKVTRDSKTDVITVDINEVANLIGRHYKDSVEITVFQVTSDGKLGALSCRTSIAINDLDLRNQQKKPISIVSTKRMKKAGPAYYVMFDLDVSFRPINQDIIEEVDPVEFAIEQWALLKGKKRKEVTETEILMIKLLLERLESAHNLTDNQRRFRKCFFMLKNMRNLSFINLDREMAFDRMLTMKVVPKIFFFNINEACKDFETSNLFTQAIRREMKAMSDARNKIKIDRYKDIPYRPNAEVEKSAVFVVKFLSGLKMRKYLIENPKKEEEKAEKKQEKNKQDKEAEEEEIVQTSDYKDVKLIIKDCFREEDVKVLYESGNFSAPPAQHFLKGKKFMLRNFGARSVLKFELYGEKKISGEKGTELITSAIFKLKEDEVLTTWDRKEAELDFGEEFGKIKFSYISCFSEFTKNPSKVVNFTFFRLVNLHKKDDIVKIENLADQDQQKKAMKIFVAEEEVGMNQSLNMEMLGKGLLKKVDEFRSKTYNTMLGEEKNFKPPQPGSTNHQIQELIGEHVNNAKYRLEFTYQNAVERKGLKRARETVYLNPKGQNVDYKIKKFNIHNQNHDAHVRVRLFIDSQKPAKDQGLKNTQKSLAATQELVNDEDNPYLSKSQTECIAETTFSLAEIQVTHNTLLSFVLPLEPSSTLLSNSHLQQKYNVDRLHALCQVRITDQTFGEVQVDLKQFTRLPKSEFITYIQSRVFIRHSEQAVLYNKAFQKYKNTSLLEEEQKIVAAKEEADRYREKTTSKGEDIFDPDAKDTPKKSNEQQLRDLEDDDVIIGEPLESMRQEYNFMSAKFFLTSRELSFPIQMKDIFGDSAFYREGALTLFEQYNKEIVIQLYAYDEANTRTCLGQKVVSLLWLIQKLTLERKAQEEQDMLYKRVLDQNKENLTEEEKKNLGKQKVDVKEVMMRQQMKDLSKCSERVQKMYQEQYKSFQQTQKQVHQEEQERMSRTKSQYTVDDLDTRSDAGSLADELDNGEENKEGYVMYPLSREGITGKEDDNLQGGIEGLIKTEGREPYVTLRLDFEFGFNSGFAESDAFIFEKERDRHLQILKEEQSIKAILETLNVDENFKGEGQRSIDENIFKKITTKKLSDLLSAIASQSTWESSEDEKPDAVKYMSQIIQTMTKIYRREDKIEKFTVIVIMKILTILKIICSKDERQMDNFRDYLQTSGFFISMIEIFLKPARKEANSMRTEVIKFLTAFITDMPRLYFIDGSIGHNLDELLAFIDLGRDDIMIVEVYGKFLKACLGCLFGKPKTVRITKEEKKEDKKEQDDTDEDLVTDNEEDKKQKEEEEKKKEEEERKRQIQEGEAFPEEIQHQVMQVAKSIEYELKEICSGATRFKHEHEKCCQAFLSAGFEFLHLAILTNRLGEMRNDFTRSLIFQNIFKILMDSLMKNLSTDFITSIRDRLLYEISLTEKLNRRKDLALSFDPNVLKQLFDAMVKYFDKLLYKNQKMEVEEIHMNISRWSGMRNILDFFYTRDTINQIVDEYERQIMRISKAPYDFEVKEWLYNCLRIGDEIGSQLGDSVRKEFVEARTQKRRKDPMLAPYLI